jgi:phosphonate transport system substrate-binding protein
LYIGGIPDQDVSTLEARFKGLAQYLTEKTGIKVEYIPTIDYAAVVTAFRNGDIQLAWYGGLTGVQARLAVPNAQAIAQRPEDQEFHSVFMARKGLGISSLADLKGRTFTFGSESSTSGHLMPRFFLKEAGITPEKDFAAVNYSGSHDTTWKLVESGSFDAGVLNELVWKQRVREGAVNLSKVEVILTTAPYYDYHWVIRSDVDEKFGLGTSQKLREALLGLRADAGEQERAILQAFQSDRFVPTTNENYQAIESVGRDLGIIR